MKNIENIEYRKIEIYFNKKNIEKDKEKNCISIYEYYFKKNIFGKKGDWRRGFSDDIRFWISPTIGNPPIFPIIHIDEFPFYLGGWEKVIDYAKSKEEAIEKAYNYAKEYVRNEIEKYRDEIIYKIIDNTGLESKL